MKNTLTIFMLLLAVALPLFFNMFQSFRMMEGYSNFHAGSTSSSDLLIKDTFPVKQVSTKPPSSVWWKYPIFKVGSYAQITNNLRYFRNPDIGSCTPSDFCDSMYDDIKNKSNYITPLAPVDDSTGTRVGYFVA
jgi:hypothetical protein